MGRSAAWTEISDCAAIVLAGGRGSRLHELTHEECKPAIPFAGVCRLIDFTIANAVNSGFYRLMVATQYLPATLSGHLRTRWRPAIGRLGGSLDILTADAGTGGGTASVILRNVERIDALAPTNVLIAAGDHIYQMDYGDLVAEHLSTGAGATVAAHEVDICSAREFGVFTCDRAGRVVAFDEKPPCPRPMRGRPDRALASMGVYVFDWPLLRTLLLDAARIGRPLEDFGKDVIPAVLARGRLQAHRFAPPRHLGAAAPYWRDVGTIDAFFDAHFDLFGRARSPIDTERWPLHVADLEHAYRSCEDQSSRLEFGKTELVDTVAGPSSSFGPNCRLAHCVVMDATEIGHGARLASTLIAPGTRVPPGLVVGEDLEEDSRWFRRTQGGTTLVTAPMLARREAERPLSRPVLPLPWQQAKRPGGAPLSVRRTHPTIAPRPRCGRPGTLGLGALD